MKAHQREANWCEYGLRAWVLLMVLFVAGRALGAYQTPWIVVLAPIWAPLAWLVLSVAQLFVRFGLWALFRGLFPW